MNINELKALARTIKNEERIGANTHGRVGSTLESIIDNLLSKSDVDTASKLITFIEGIKTGTYLTGKTGSQIDGEGNAELKILLVREIITSLLGLKVGDYERGVKGGQIDQYGNAEFESAIIRGFLEVPELRYNRVKINIGDSWSAPGGGIIQSVDLVNKIITLKLEDGEIGTIQEDDICMGIFHSNITGENSTENIDDSKGNRAFAGFATSYFRVTEVLNSNNSQFRYELRPQSEGYSKQVDPKASMTFVAYGNFTDTDRQTSHYDTRTYQRYLKNMNSWEIGVNNIAAQFGDLSNLSIHGLTMTGYSAYLNNIYMTGTIQQFKLAEPLRMEIDSSLGYMLAPGETTNLTVKIFKGWVELTQYMESWTWTRDTGVPQDDEVWNNAHSNLTSNAAIAYSDLGSTVNTNNSCLFTIKATFIEENIPQSVTQTIAI